MKKFAIGCAIVLAVVAVLGGAALYWAYSKAKDYVGAFSEVSKVTELAKDVKNKEAFTPPADGLLTAAQVDRFLAVNEAVQQSMGPRFQELKTRYDEIDARMRSEDRKATAAESLGAIRDFAGLMSDVRKAQVQAFNAHNVSVDEYRWVRDAVYGALGVPIGAFNIGAFVDAAQSGDTGKVQESLEARTEASLSAPEANKALVHPHAEKLKNWVGVAWLGF